MERLAGPFAINRLARGDVQCERTLWPCTRFAPSGGNLADR